MNNLYLFLFSPLPAVIPSSSFAPHVIYMIFCIFYEHLSFRNV
uniref:Uncharacterized protein n=1 Tax=Anguilla anguilla TaxID=7936 RepID=A0A0E9WHW5_ANGAN